MITLIHNIGTIVSGELGKPAIQASDSKLGIIIQDGIITKIGEIEYSKLKEADILINAQGTTVIPGLIDSHCHVTFGDYTPRQKVPQFLQSYMHGGITSVISAGEMHVPGCPDDAEGVKCLAVAASRTYQRFRPDGVKVLGGTVILQPDLKEQDFSYLSQQGIRLAKMGFGRFKKPQDAINQINWAKKYGIKVMTHTGGASIPGSTPIKGKDLIDILPDIAGHVNGGTTALSDNELKAVVEGTDIILQIVQAGNLRSALKVIELAQASNNLWRVIIGSDTPTGTGMMPLAILKTIAELASLTAVSVEDCIAFATGNIAKIFGFNRGVIKEGTEADLIILDSPSGSEADNACDAFKIDDIPGISLVMIDGIIRAEKSNNTPLASRLATVERK